MSKATTEGRVLDQYTGYSSDADARRAFAEAEKTLDTAVNSGDIPPDQAAKMLASFNEFYSNSRH